MESMSNDRGNSSDINERSRAWEMGFKAGLAASKSPSALGIAQALASAAEAVANASKVIAEAIVFVLQTADAQGNDKVSQDTALGVFKKSPSTFLKPPGVFRKSPSTFPVGDPATGKSPWTEEQ